MEFKYKIDEEYKEKIDKVFETSFLTEKVNEATFWKEMLDNLKKYQQGRDLLSRLDALFNIYNKQNQDTKLQLQVSFKNGASCFCKQIIKDTVNNVSFISINLDIINGTLYHEKLKLCSTIQSVAKTVQYKGEDFCCIMDCADPYWMLIAHEMIHMEHWLTQEIVEKFQSICKAKKVFMKIDDTQGKDELQSIDELYTEKNQKEIDCLLETIKNDFCDIENVRKIAPIDAVYCCLEEYSDTTLKKLYKEFYLLQRYNGNSLTDPLMLNKTVLADFPEVRSRLERKLAVQLWINMEERLTVVGSKNSELTLRLEANLPLRYIYQEKGKQFLEAFETVLYIVHAADNNMNADTLKTFINNEANSMYFDTRQFRKIINSELLATSIFDQFDTKEKLDIVLSTPKFNPKITHKLSTNFLEKKNFEKIVELLCDGKSNKILPKIKKFLGESNTQLIETFEKYLTDKRSEDDYDVNQFTDIINALKTHK